MGDSRKDLEGMEKIVLIDVSCENDLLISSSVDGFLPSFQPLENCDEQQNDSCNTLQVANPVSCSMQMEQVPILSDSPKQKRGASGKFNLRKSLAWDAAFFTSEGVLDPEELAIVNSTFRKTESNKMPMIQEDLQKSFESSSTLDSDSWTIESLEVDLFENLRASIQKSYKKCDKAPKGEHSSHRNGSGKVAARASNRVDVPSQNVQKKPPVASRRSGISKQRPEETPKEAVHAQVVGSGKGDHKSSLRPPRIASKAITPPNRRCSAPQLVQVKNSTGKATPGSVGNCQLVVASKTATRGEPCTVIPKPSRLKPSSGSSTSTKMLPVAASSLYTRSGGNSSDRKSKASLETSRTKVDSRNIDKSFSTSNIKSPSALSKSKNGSRGVGTRRGNFGSTSKLLSASPTSSIDSVASQSSSSSVSTTRNTNYSTESFDLSTLSSVWSSSEKNSPQPSGLQKFQHGGLAVIVDGNSQLQSPSIKASSGASIVAASSAIDESGNHCDKNSLSKVFKPSGLRMPSPKIGYFDADKSLVQNSIRCYHRGLQSDSPRSTSGFGVAPKPKSSKIPSLVCMNSVSQLTALSQLSSPDTRQVERTLVPASIPSPITTGQLDVKCSDKNILSSSPLEASMKNGGEHGIKMEGNPETDKYSKKAAVLVPEQLCSIQPSAVPYMVQSHLESSSFSVIKNNEKENMLPSKDKVCDSNRNSVSEGLKVTTVEQLEKRLSSLKNSLSDASAQENAGNLKSILCQDDSIKLGLHQDTSALTALSPLNFDM